MSLSVSGRKWNNNRPSNGRTYKNPIIRGNQELKKSSKSSSNLLCWLMLGICVVSLVYLLFVFHVTVAPANLQQEIRSKLREFEAMTMNKLQSIPHLSSSHLPSSTAINYGESNDRPSLNLRTASSTQSSMRCPGRVEIPPVILPSNRSEKGASNMHFIHIPKCGGTSMTAVLREMACSMNPAVNVDCCKNPGFCDWHAFRRCSIIKGCTDHFPNRAWIYKPQPSIALFREPSSRLLSAWFYRGHSPNNDFFQVRPWFKEVRDGLRPKVIFEEYIEMVEYQNIQTRMLGADSFPYRNITIDEDIYCKAIDALDHLFFVGLQEAYDISVQALLREFRLPILVEVKKERDQMDEKIAREKAILRSNASLMQRVRDNNRYDVELYHAVVERFCRMLKKYPDLLTLLHTTTKVTC